MANRIQIRHGNSIPTTSNLLPYELGWDALNKALYINDNGTILSTGGNVIINPARLFYGTCSTAANTAIKEVICNNYTNPTAGDVVIVNFTYTNSAAVADLQLDVNDTGAKSIKRMFNYALSNLKNKAELNQNVISMFIYNTDNWILVNADYNTNTTYTFDGNYDASTNPAATVATVTNAIGAAIGGSY